MGENILSWSIFTENEKNRGAYARLTQNWAQQYNLKILMRYSGENVDNSYLLYLRFMYVHFKLTFIIILIIKNSTFTSVTVFRQFLTSEQTIAVQ